MQLESSAPPAMTMEIQTSPIGPIPRRPVATIEEASRIFCLIRDRLRGGSSEFGNTLIRDESGVVVAHVSYNGAVWWGAPENWTPDAKPIFIP